MSKVGKIAINRKRISWLLNQSMNVKMEMLSRHLEISRMLINDILEDEVRGLSGERYSHEKPEGGRYSRWGFNPGSVKIGDERVRLSVPRLYDNSKKCHVSLEHYQRLKELAGVDTQLLKKILFGLSMGNYAEVVRTLLDSFGLSASTVSRRFVEQSAQKLAEFEARKFHDHEFVGLFIDGKYFAQDQMVIVLGVTLEGEKIPLGFIQTYSENGESIGELLRQLVDRGLKYKNGLICVIDGSKGIHKAVKEVFGPYVEIQRCQWHKRENVVSYLKQKDQIRYRKRLNKAYQSESYEEAKEQLCQIYQELHSINLSAARSLEEGLEETLTLHRLGLNEEFGRSFSTTNCIENLNSQLAKYVGKVKYWKDSEQRHRWIASALMEVEKHMRKVPNYRKMPLMQAKLKLAIDAESGKGPKAE